MQQSDLVCKECHKPLTANESRCNSCGYDPEKNVAVGREVPTSVGGVSIEQLRELVRVTS